MNRSKKACEKFLSFLFLVITIAIINIGVVSYYRATQTNAISCDTLLSYRQWEEAQEKFRLGDHKPLLTMFENEAGRYHFLAGQIYQKKNDIKNACISYDLAISLDDTREAYKDARKELKCK